jgi:hypothetical protein
LRAHRDKTAARRYFEKAIDQNGAPETVTVDTSGANLAALQAINAEGQTPIKIRQCKSEQHCKAGSPGHQTDTETDAGLQGFSVRAHHFVRHRGHAYDSERTDAGELLTIDLTARTHEFMEYFLNPRCFISGRPKEIQSNSRIC